MQNEYGHGHGHGHGHGYVWVVDGGCIAPSHEIRPCLCVLRSWSFVWVLIASNESYIIQSEGVLERSLNFESWKVVRICGWGWRLTCVSRYAGLVGVYQRGWTPCSALHACSTRTLKPNQAVLTVTHGHLIAQAAHVHAHANVFMFSCSCLCGHVHVYVVHTQAYL